MAKSTDLAKKKLENMQKENLVKVADTTISATKRKPEEEEEEEKNKDNENGGKIADSVDGVAKKKKAKLGTGLPLSMQKEDLFDAHNFDIEIDVDTTNLASNPSNLGVGVMTAPLNIKPPAKEGPTTKRSLNLDDYKKKRGLI